jgi:hypothetical protein
VNVFESASHLAGNGQLVLQISEPAVAYGLTQVFSFEELHDHEWPMPFIFAAIVNAQNVVVNDVSYNAGFSQESILELRIRNAFGRKNFHGDSAPDHGVASAVHVRHPAAQKFLQFVLADAGWKL